MGGGDNSHKLEKRRLSTEQSSSRDDKSKDNKRSQKQNHDYSRLEGGERARISPEDLGDLIAEADTDKLEKYGGLKGVAGALNTDLERGLSESDLEERKKTYLTAIYGENRPPEKPQRGYFRFVWDALQDKTLIILAICAAVSIVLGVTVEEDKKTGWIDGAAILVAVCIVVFVTATNDYSKDKKFRKLSEIRDEQQITVVRDGQQKSISIFDVLVGDIVELEPGAPIPADGESDSVRKDEEDPFMLSGCTILEGVCQMLVIAVGENSQKGKISALLDTPNEDTPLTKKLEHLANLKEHRTWHWSELGTIVKFLISAITIVVVAVPEGLPLAVTISLAYSMMKMMKDQNLVRHLEACETMGGATNICSDKTGTLTENRMTVSKIYLAGEELGEEDSTKELNEKVSRLFTEGISLNSNAYLAKKGEKKENDKAKGKGKENKEEEEKEKHSMKDKLLHHHHHDKAQEAAEKAAKKANDDDRPEFVGNKTECALLLYLTQEMEVNYDDIRKQNKKNIAKLYPFSSDRKMMSTAVRTEEGDAEYVLYCKGASEMVLKQCSNVINKDGEVEELDDEERERLEDLIEEFASSGLRTIGLAYREFSDEPDWEDDDDVIQELTFLGIAGIMDPVRKEVPDAVEKCKKAGIIVRMITGDNLLTAKHIAKECGILTEDGLAIEGPKFRKMSEAEIDEILPKLQVIARAAPTDKYILVHRLRELGEVVAVTGDGVNDAPQLKEADVGFAMGITGTEVAKDASDIVLLDDNFSSIVKAVMWGRNVYDSIRKFIQFQLTVNLVAVAIAFIGSVSDGESPLTPVQLLWVNLIMDTFAALALATERPTEDLLDRKPYGRYDKLITRTMWRNIISQALFQLAVLLVMLYAVDIIPFVNLPSKDDPTAYNEARNTLLFNTFVMCQLFNEINSRKLGNELNVFKRFFSNPVFLGVMAITLVGQFLLVQFAGAFASTRPLTINQWIVSVVIGAVSLPIGLAMRGLVRIKDKKPTAEDIKKAQEKEKEKEEKQAKKDKKKGKGDDEKESEKPKDFGDLGKQIGKKKKAGAKGDKSKDEKRTDKSESKKTPKREKDGDDERKTKDKAEKKERDTEKEGDDKEERRKKREKREDDSEGETKKTKTKEVKEKKDKDTEKVKKTTEEKTKKKDKDDEDKDTEKKEKTRKSKKQRDDDESSSDEEIKQDKKQKKEKKDKKEDEQEDFWGRERKLEKGEEKQPEFWSHERDLEAGMTEDEKRRMKGKGSVSGSRSDRDFRSMSVEDKRGRRKSGSFSENSLLLPKIKEEKESRDLWGTAANVVTQVSVINALRNQRRRSTVVAYPTTKSNQVTLAKHRRRMSRTNLMLKRSGNING